MGPYISQLFSKILDKLCGKSRPPPNYQIKDKKMVRFGRTCAVWESQAGCHFSTNAQRAMNFLIYSAKIQEFKEAFVSIIRKMSTDVPLVERSRFAKVLKNFSKFLIIPRYRLKAYMLETCVAVDEKE